MENLYSRLCAGCVVLVLASASPAFGGSDTPSGALTDYLVTNSTSASGWTTVTLIPLKVECERILRSVSMDVYALGGTGRHGHEPARVTCDGRDGHFSVQVDMNGGTIGDMAGHVATEQRRSAIYVPAITSQATQGPAGGNRDHQHVVHIFHDLE